MENQKVTEEQIVTDLGTRLDTRLTVVENSDILTVIVPGAQATCHGENKDDKRYDQVASYLTERGVSVLQSANIFTDENGFFDEEGNIKSILNYADAVAEKKYIVGFGFSAGARMLAQYSWQFPKRLLGLTLVNPDPGHFPEYVVDGLEKCALRRDIVVGLNDTEERQQFAKELIALDPLDTNEIYIPDADHMFTNKEHVFAELGKYVLRY